jgi:hypothetical protein
MNLIQFELLKDQAKTNSLLRLNWAKIERKLIKLK